MPNVTLVVDHDTALRLAAAVAVAVIAVQDQTLYGLLPNASPTTEAAIELFATALVGPDPIWDAAHSGGGDEDEIIQAAWSSSIAQLQQVAHRLAAEAEPDA